MIDRHRDEIAAVLTERGLIVKTDVGLSDFRIDLTLASASDPAQPLVAVLLDGEGWRARRTVADRDGLPVDVLGKLMRWPGIERVWLPEWLDDPDATATDSSRRWMPSRPVVGLRRWSGSRISMSPHGGAG